MTEPDNIEPVDAEPIAAEPRLETAGRLVSDVLGPLKSMFVGKDAVVDLLGVGLVARENVFLYGPPGTAKSAVVNELARRIDGRVFDYLLTRFTEPNEIFGPFDIRQLREGELVTNTEGMLPEADLAFLDELLNANSAILNALLLALNERIFRRGRETRTLPTLLVCAAGNSLPEDETLAALFDRFLLRVPVYNVETERLGEVLQAGWSLQTPDRPDTATVSVEDLRRLQTLVAEVDLTAVRSVYADTVAAIRRVGIDVSDRRAVRFQRLLAGSAILSGRTVAEVSDLWVLRYTWDRLEQQSVLAQLIGDTIETAGGDDAGPAHPQSAADAMPDAETLARDLESLQAEIRSADDGERLQLRDRVAAVAGRVQWIGPGTQRDALDERVNALWRALA